MPERAFDGILDFFFEESQGEFLGKPQEKQLNSEILKKTSKNRLEKFLEEHIDEFEKQIFEKKIKKCSWFQKELIKRHQG